MFNHTLHKPFPKHTSHVWFKRKQNSGLLIFAEYNITSIFLPDYYITLINPENMLSIVVYSGITLSDI